MEGANVSFVLARPIVHIATCNHPIGQYAPISNAVVQLYDALLARRKFTLAMYQQRKQDKYPASGPTHVISRAVALAAGR